MDKKPLIPVSEEPVDIWYESPSVMLAKKPAGLKVHPDSDSDKDTLLNRLFQHNRWLADMEHSMTAGVLHFFEPQDHGLMIFNKSDDYEEALRKALSENSITFSYIIHVKENTSIELRNGGKTNLELQTKNNQAGFVSYDVKTTEGNTNRLRELLFPAVAAEEITFYCYSIELELPHSGETHSTSLRDTEKGIPQIAVYHAPP